MIRQCPIYFLVFFAIVFIGHGSFAQQYKISRFVSAQTCGDCHDRIYSQWKNSMHNLSHKDPVYRSVAAYFLKQTANDAELKEAESCVKCHIPVGVLSGKPIKTSQNDTKVSQLAGDGIQCDYCHNAVDYTKMYNNGLVVTPGNGEDDPGVKRGPRKDAVSDYHDTAYSALHTESAICGTCHNVRHVAYDTKLEQTYDEWKNGPYNDKDPAKRVTCQGCHMYQRPGAPATGATPRKPLAGTSAFGGKKREHVFTHYFIGANSYVPGKFGDKTKSQMAIDRLQHAAELAVTADNAKGTIQIRITNTGAGHYLPTGLTDVRQMWLEIVVRNNKGNTIFTSGIPDKKGYLPSDTIIYNTVFGDSNKKPVTDITRAQTIIKDKRIPPKQFVNEAIKLPSESYKKLTVVVKLKYRAAPQRLIDSVPGTKKVRLPIIMMASVEKEFVK